ncbi:MAG: Hpt domain [Thermoplasmata archaeon]|jgi:HPt (histidine-containing phosphotransfer) domain-containing protein|nr:Hpt domain [Thermoplasmata archaeon]
MASHGTGKGSLDERVLGHLLRAMGSDAEFREMLHEFLLSSDALLADLNAAAWQGRLHDLERTAHTMKSMAHVVGALALETTCRDLELQARGHQEVPYEAVHGLSTQIHEAQGAVERFLS